MQVKKQQLESNMEQWTGYKLGKEYIKVYCHPAYLTYMQSILCEMPCWMKHNLESRFLGEISGGASAVPLGGRPVTQAGGDSVIRRTL